MEFPCCGEDALIDHPADEYLADTYFPCPNCPGRVFVLDYDGADGESWWVLRAIQ